MSTIGTNIKNRRKALGMTQDELASKMGYKSKSTINKIETGINDIPQSKITRFAEALSTTPAHLMGWHGVNIGTRSDQSLAKNIQSYRKEAGISTKEMALLLDVNEETVLSIEQSEYKLDKEMIFRICDILHVTPDFLDGIIAERLEHGDIDAEYCYTRFPNTSISTPFLSSSNEKESQVLFAYRTHPEMQPAVDRLLGIEKDDKIVLYQAAHSDNNAKDGYIKKDKTQWNKIEKASETEDDLL